MMKEGDLGRVEMDAWWGEVSDTEWRCNSKMVIGGVEIFAGLLCCIPPGPWGKRVGGGLIWDGVTRFGDGLTEIGEENEKRYHRP